MCTTAWRVAGRRSSRLAIDRRFLLPFRFVRLGRTSARHGKCAQNRDSLSSRRENNHRQVKFLGYLYVWQNHTSNLIVLYFFFSTLRVILMKSSMKYLIVIKIARKGIRYGGSCREIDTVNN